MTDLIDAGTILMEEGTPIPQSVQLESKPYCSGWATIGNPRFAFEKAIQEAGWTFFFVAGGITAAALGFDRNKTLHTAVRRIIATTKVRNCNSVEIIRVISTTFLGVPYVRVSAHLRHIQQGTVLHQPLALPEQTISLSAPAFRRP